MIGYTSENYYDVVIVGAGFSGVAAAVNILRNAGSRRLRVVLVEKGTSFGRGVAYSAEADDCLLNVVAGNMSLHDDDREHFVSYCKEIGLVADGGTFVARRHYGEYLDWALRTEEETHPGILSRLSGEVISVTPELGQDRFFVRLQSGAVISSSKVVLALGNFPPTAGFIHDSLRDRLMSPWDFAAQDRVAQHVPIIIIGTGHTAVDIVVRLSKTRPNCNFNLISRHGLIPNAHHPTTRARPPKDYRNAFMNKRPTLRTLASFIRREVSRSSEGNDWRDVINDLRPEIPRFWRLMSDAERARFVKKLRSFWDVHRHRLAPVTARKFQELISSQRVITTAGKIVRIIPYGQYLKVIYIERGQEVKKVMIGAVINCTGPATNPAAISSPLVRQLITSGLLVADKMGLGIGVNESYNVIDSRGVASKGLHYIGPFLRARYWESTSVPELRGHASRVAQLILNSLVRDGNYSS